MMMMPHTASQAASIKPNLVIRLHFGCRKKAIGWGDQAASALPQEIDEKPSPPRIAGERVPSVSEAGEVEREMFREECGQSKHPDRYLSTQTTS